LIFKQLQTAISLSNLSHFNWNKRAAELTTLGDSR
jgi:hypothetical protein